MERGKPAGWKRLVVCCDGTWNAPEINNPQKNRPTNVLKLSRAINSVDRQGVVQVVEYVAGVGTNALTDRWLGGATGWGLSRNLQQAYRFIADNYRHGDDLYLFGFSRGAFTVRSLSGFIHAQGIIRKEKMHLFPQAYDAYRMAPERRSRSALCRKFGEDFEALSDPDFRQVPIYFLGVWDTVGALGAPTPLLGRLTRRWISFHDTRLVPNVLFACQALALHELRAHFKPVLWTEKEDGQVVEQIWFPGAHSDVGGGYEKTGLSDQPLAWMAERAERTGLELNRDYLGSILHPDPAQPVAISRRFPYSLVRPYVRPVGPSTLDGIKPVSLEEYGHPSVPERLAKLGEGERRYDREPSFRRVDELSRTLPPMPEPGAAAQERERRGEEERYRRAKREVEALAQGLGRPSGGAVGEGGDAVSVGGVPLKKRKGWRR